MDNNERIISSDSNTIFRWDNSYILPYETRTSIRERFRLFNYIADSKIIQQIEDELIDWNANGYSENTIFDDTKKRDTFRYYPLSQNMRYCPVCARYGYISYLHLNRLFSRCFLHDCDLIELNNVPARPSAYANYPYTYKSFNYSECFQLYSVAEIIKELPALKKKIENKAVPYLDRFKKISLFSFDTSSAAVERFQNLIDNKYLRFWVLPEDVSGLYNEIIERATDVVVACREQDDPYSSLDSFYMESIAESVRTHIIYDVAEAFQFQLLHSFLFGNSHEYGLPTFLLKNSSYNDLANQFSADKLDFALKASFCYTISDRKNPSMVFNTRPLYHSQTGEKMPHDGMLKRYADGAIYVHDEKLNTILIYEILKVYITENWKRYQETLLGDYNKYYKPVPLYIAVTERIDGQVELYVSC